MHCPAEVAIEMRPVRGPAAERINLRANLGGDWERDANDNGFRVCTHGWDDGIVIPGGRGVIKSHEVDRNGL